jgi:hypothetical protein
VIRTWRRFRALNPGDRLLVQEAAIVLFLVWAGLAALGFSALRRLLDRYARTRVPRDRAAVGPDRIGWAVIAVARRSPVPMTCLRQALAADAMLRRRGLASELRLGVQRRSDASILLQSHAWVECEGRVVVGGIEQLADYSVLAAPGGP